MRSACPPIMYGCKFLNFSRSTSDMDLIARKKNCLCFVEVKTRNSESEYSFESRPAASVNPEKQRRLIKIATEYAHRIHKESGCMMRMDIIEVLTHRDTKGKIKVKKIVHIESAFDLNSAYKIRK